MTREDVRSAVTDRIALVATLLGECANEPIEGQVAVACVIRNRVEHPRWWGRGWKGVCLARMQFSCWWETTANTARVYALAEAMLTRQAETGPRSVVGQLEWVATGAMNDLFLDNTHQSDHYLTSSMWRSHPPNWASGRSPKVVKGAHAFFNLEI